MISVKTIFLDYVCDDTTKTPVMVAIEWKLDLKDARYLVAMVSITSNQVSKKHNTDI